MCANQCFSVPLDWESGIYSIQISSSPTEFPYDLSMLMTFVVREDVPGSHSKIAVLDNAATQIAYNRWGGASSYWFATPDQVRGHLLSITRPGNNFYQWTESRFDLWAWSLRIANTGPPASAALSTPLRPRVAT